VRTKSASISRQQSEQHAATAHLIDATKLAIHQLLTSSKPLLLLRDTSSAADFVTMQLF
jgi:hypothetical protein